MKKTRIYAVLLALLVVSGTVLLSGCTFYPTQEAKFMASSITIDGGRMFRDYEATETLNLDGTKTRSFKSSIVDYVPDWPKINFEEGIM